MNQPDRNIRTNPLMRSKFCRNRAVFSELSALSIRPCHHAAWESVCDEAAGLPNATPGSGGSQCSDLPTVVCIHDAPNPGDPGDPNCGNLYNAGVDGTTGCPVVAAGTSNVQTGGAEASKYVEVRVCYRFSAFFGMDIPFLGGALSPLAGNFYLERVRTFTVADF